MRRNVEIRIFNSTDKVNWLLFEIDKNRHRGIAGKLQKKKTFARIRGETIGETIHSIY